jgi:hypothetical protein
VDTRIIVAYMVFRAHDSLEAHIRREVMAEYILDVGSVISNRTGAIELSGIVTGWRRRQPGW